jgi:hypothetical protein
MLLELCALKVFLPAPVERVLTARQFKPSPGQQTGGSNPDSGCDGEATAPKIRSSALQVTADEIADQLVDRGQDDHCTDAGK